ncbi:MAG: hypothetical protein GY862_26600 [Gammaproteobacteria bacterium]|nr:hypothetical protein [Gammaproteobacteria bacterium]
MQSYMRSAETHYSPAMMGFGTAKSCLQPAIGVHLYPSYSHLISVDYQAMKLGNQNRHHCIALAWAPAVIVSGATQRSWTAGAHPTIQASARATLAGRRLAV